MGDLLKQFLSDCLQNKEQLRSLQKLLAMSRLSAEVNHDFRNIMGGITGYSYLLKTDDGVKKETVEQLEIIEASAQQALDLVKQFLAVSRPRPFKKEIINLNAVVQQAQTLLTPTLKTKVPMTLQLAPALANTVCDPVQIVQILLDMGLYALDVLPEGGGMEIVTRARTQELKSSRDDPSLTPNPQAPTPQSDQPGASHLNRVEILSTITGSLSAKAAALETTLWFAVANDILMDLGGGVAVKEQQGNLLVFVLWLPMAY